MAWKVGEFFKMYRFSNIVFVFDPKLGNPDAFDRAISLAKNNQAQLTVVSTLENLPKGYSQRFWKTTPAEIEKSLADNLLAQLNDLVAPIRKVIQVSVKVLKGKPFLQIIQEVLRNKMDLVVKTAEDGGITSRFFGSTDLELLRNCPSPVLLLNSSKDRQFKKILAAVDFNPRENDKTENAFNRQILQMSTALALSEGSELHIIHVWDAYGESSLRSGLAKTPEKEVDAYVEEIRVGHEKKLKKLMTEFDGETGNEATNYLKPKVHLVKGNAKKAIPDFVEKNQIDLVVMGTVGRTGIPGFIMGNTAETILNQIDCSVLALKPKGFVTPITL